MLSSPKWSFHFKIVLLPCLHFSCYAMCPAYFILFGLVNSTNQTAHHYAIYFSLCSFHYLRYQYGYTVYSTSSMFKYLHSVFFPCGDRPSFVLRWNSTVIVYTVVGALDKIWEDNTFLTEWFSRCAFKIILSWILLIRWTLSLAGDRLYSTSDMT